MLRSFGNKETERIFNGEHSRKFPSTILKAARRKLGYLDYAVSLQDLRMPPHNRLEKLKGDLKNHYSIRINDQYRIIFKWDVGYADDVEIIDYH